MTKSLHPAILLSASSLSDTDQVAIVDMLEQALEQARAGKMQACAVLACMEGGFAHAMAGRRAGDLYMAAGDLQAEILTKVKGARSIMRAR